MDDEQVPIEFPDGIVETVAEWLEADDGSVGLCLGCGRRIWSQEDLDTNHRRCRSMDDSLRKV